ncbi:MAG TPA: hypothetical protein VFT90_17995, partial [Chryseosolibacter sp.]|nr:hypothetical protein [Chryseosolibacter sp.]
DSLYSYMDVTPRAGVRNFYTILSIDDAGLESEPASPVAGAIPVNALKNAVELKKPRINREENAVTLMWDEPEGVVEAFRIFRSVDHGPMMAYQTITGEQPRFVDIVIPGKTYRYRILSLFANGQQSAVSNELEVVY